MNLKYNINPPLNRSLNADTHTHHIRVPRFVLKISRQHFSSPHMNCYSFHFYYSITYYTRPLFIASEAVFFHKFPRMIVSHYSGEFDLDSPSRRPPRGTRIDIAILTAAPDRYDFRKGVRYTSN